MSTKPKKSRKTSEIVYTGADPTKPVGYKNPPKETQFPPGVSGNPGGRPVVLGEAYKKWLARVNDQGLTNAQIVAMSMGSQAMLGKVDAAREIRAATEGDQININDTGLTDEARADRIAAILDRARARRIGSADPVPSTDS